MLAMVSDCIDGYFARKNKSVSKFGAILDPLMDKFFVYFVLAVCYLEKDLKLWQAFTFLSRDIALIIFAIYLTVKRKWETTEWRAFFWGKVSTASQFAILLLLTFKLTIPSFVYIFLVIFGLLALREFFHIHRVRKKE